MKSIFDKRFRARVIATYSLAICVSLTAEFLFPPLVGIVVYILSFIPAFIRYNRFVSKVTHYVKDNFPDLYKEKTGDSANAARWNFTSDLTPAIKVANLSEEEISLFSKEIRIDIYRARFAYKVRWVSFLVFIVSLFIIGAYVFPTHN